METGLKRIKVKFATTWNEREAIIQKHGYDMIAGTPCIQISDWHQVEYTGAQGGEAVLHWVDHPRYVQAHHRPLLLQCVQKHIR